MNTYIDIWSCQSSDLGTLQHYCTMLCGYFHSGRETRAHLSDCVNEQYRGLRAIYVCNRHGWLRAVSEYNSGSVCGSLSWTSTEHRLRTAGFRLFYFFLISKMQLLRLLFSFNDMLQCDNLYGRHVQCPVSSWSVVGEVALKKHTCELSGDIAESVSMFAVKSRRDICVMFRVHGH